MISLYRSSYLSENRALVAVLEVAGVIDCQLGRPNYQTCLIHLSSIFSFMTLAASQTATRITALVSNGDGTLKIDAAIDATTITGAVIGYPIDPVTTTGATARIKVRIA